jgi:hypothetical protein
MAKVIITLKDNKDGAGITIKYYPIPKAGEGLTPAQESATQVWKAMVDGSKKEDAP